MVREMCKISAPKLPTLTLYLTNILEPNDSNSSENEKMPNTGLANVNPAGVEAIDVIRC